MKKEPKIIEEFRNSVIMHFESPEEFEKFLHTKEHFWSVGDHTEDLSPYEFLTKSRRSDKLNFMIKTVIELKCTILGFE